MSDFKEWKKLNENGSKNLILNKFKVGFFKKLIELHNFKKPTYLKQVQKCYQFSLQLFVCLFVSVWKAF